jgi:hypothetical protein
MDATAQKKKVFYKSALEFHFASISGLGMAYFVKKMTKSFYPAIHAEFLV